MGKHCCVAGCTTTGQRTFRLPQPSKDKGRFLSWLAVCGNTSLLNIPPDKMINRTVCIVHFESKFIMAKKLSTSAVPTLHLPEKIDVSSYKIDSNNTIESATEFDENPSKRTDDIAVPERSRLQLSERQTSDEFGLGRKQDSDDACQKQGLRNKKKKAKPLSLFRLSRKGQLSSTEKDLHGIITRLSKSVKQAQRTKATLMSRLKHAEKFLGGGLAASIASIPETSKNFVISYLRNMNRHKHSRRYSMKDKIFALALYKRSSGAYRFLQNIFALPSVETLRKLITKIPLQPGICPTLFQTIGSKICKMKDSKSKYCTLIFDETELEPYLHFQTRTGTIHGFVDSGYERQSQIANHATVWILKSVQGNWKQPILYSFCNATANSEDIARTFRDIVREAKKVGLQIIASICDQGATNGKALKKLVAGSNHESFDKDNILRRNMIVIDGQVIVPLYDPPHLMKCIRNNLLTKNLRFVLKDGVERVAKWSDIETAYKIDKSTHRLMTKLTDCHVYMGKINKMKVKLCTQLFSSTVAGVMSLMSLCGTCAGDLSMPFDGDDTAQFLQFMNDLFDSVNGGFKKPTLTTASDDGWNESIDVLRTMKFIPTKRGEKVNPIVLNNWITTLEGFKYLKNYLKELGFDSFSTRIFNQDDVENFFGQIKQHGARNTKPNCTHFDAHYKTLLLRNFSQTNTRFNCETQEASNFLVDLEKIVNNPIAVKHFEFPAISEEILVLPSKYFDIDSKFFAESARSSIKNCKTCLDYVFDNSSLGSIGTVCNTFDKAVRQMTELMPYYISRFIHTEGFGKALIEQLIQKDTFAFLQCEHKKELLNVVITKYVESTVNQYLQKVNRILSGKESFDTNIADTLMLQAHKLHKNRCHRRTAIKS